MDAKPFFVLLIFILVIAIIASGIIGNVDLTDDGLAQPTARPEEALVVNLAGGGGGGPSSSSASGGTGGQPVTGKSTSNQNSPCAPVYTVQSGDTLSSIARKCLISIEDMLAQNPSITNPNIISVGQKITISRALPVVTARPTTKPTAGATVVQGAISPSFVATMAPGKKSGEAVRVRVQGFPASSNVRIAIGRAGQKQNFWRQVKTDKNGRLVIDVPIPQNAKENEQWTVTVFLTKDPKVTVTSEPFVIGK